MIDTKRLSAFAAVLSLLLHSAAVLSETNPPSCYQSVEIELPEAIADREQLASLESEWEAFTLQTTSNLRCIAGYAKQNKESLSEAAIGDLRALYNADASGLQMLTERWNSLVRSSKLAVPD
ncbi:MAG: hypothetical protein QNJ19_17645 [Woeseiaceae bacterium]|nr:hypothetical protein [Woeseiaceae bacterium]